MQYTIPFQYLSPQKNPSEHINTFFLKAAVIKYLKINTGGDTQSKLVWNLWWEL